MPEFPVILTTFRRIIGHRESEIPPCCFLPTLWDNFISSLSTVVSTIIYIAWNRYCWRFGHECNSLALHSGKKGGGHPVETLAIGSEDRYQRPVRYGMIFGGKTGRGSKTFSPRSSPAPSPTLPGRGSSFPTTERYWPCPGSAQSGIKH
jgi:hypothetical protein